MSQNSDNYQKALIKIEVAKQVNSTELDLSGLMLTELPPEIWELLNLSILNLSLNKLNQLPTNFKKLSKLTKLFLFDNKLKNFPNAIFECKNLKTLSLGKNSLQTIPIELGKLKNLEALYLNRNELNSLPVEIRKLNNLKELHLDDNLIKKIPRGLLELEKLETLLLHNNPHDIPAEILGSNSLNNLDAQKILSYLRESAKSEDRELNETKMLVVGQGEVGKSSLIRRITKNFFEDYSIKTNGIDILPFDIKINNRSVRLNIWDFGGQEVMHATHQFFLTQRSIYLLVLSARRDLEANRADYWLSLIEQYGGTDVPIILVINKIDDNPILTLNESSLKRNFNVKAIIRTSCKTGEGIKKLLNSLQTELEELKHVTDTIPGKWFNVKEALEAKKGKNDIINFETFNSLCAKQSIEEKNRLALLQLLHDLGTVINYYEGNYKSVLEEIQILNPEWVTDGVYSVINSPMVFENKGVLDRSDLGEILVGEGYRGFLRQEFILGMMEQFELAFPFNNKQSYLIPDLLPGDEPEVSEFSNETLNFEYHYPKFIPPSLFSRFVVRQHGKINNPETELWKNGVVINFDGLRGLVQEEHLQHKIIISIGGEIYRRRELLAVIRSTFDEIHDSYANLDVQAKIPIPGEKNASVSYEALLAHEKKELKEIFVPFLGDWVEISPLLIGVDGPKSNRELLQIVKKRFTRSELNVLLFEMGIDYEVIDASDRGQSEYAVELLRFLQRNNYVEKFLKEMKKSRPDLRNY